MTVTLPTKGTDGDLLARTDRGLPKTSRRRYRPSEVVITILLVLFGVLMISPLVWLIVTALTPADQAFVAPPKWLPIPFTMENFGGAFEFMPIGQQFINSVIVAAISTAGSLLVSVLAAYGFARIRFRGSGVLLVVLLSALMVPPQLLIIPVFIGMREVQLVDSLPSIWLPALINVFQIFFLTQYFRTIPRDLDEAARLDGASHGWILFRLLVPLSSPALAALAILGLELSWNNYLGPLIFLHSPENMTLPLGLVVLQNGFGAAPTAVVFAAVTLVVLPVLIVFLFFQRQFVESVASTGLKG